MIKVKVADNFKKKEIKDDIKEEKDKLNKNGKKVEQKLRLIDLKEAHNLELEKIAYITLTDGSIVIIKNQGENLVQDLLKFKNPIKNDNKKIRIIDPFHSKSFSQKKIEMPTNKKVPQKQYNYHENAYKNKNNNNLPRNKSYNRNSNSELNQRTYVISTGYSNYIDTKLKEITGFPDYSNTFNKSNINPDYSNQETQKIHFPLSHYKTNSVNIYQNQQSNYLDIPKNKYIYKNSRNYPQPNYVESSNTPYLYRSQNQNKNTARQNYSNYMRNCRLIEETPVQLYDSWNYNDNLIKNNSSNPQLVKPYYQMSQQNNRYQYQKYPINYSDRNPVNYRYNSNKKSNNQMFESLNDFDNLEEEQYNSKNYDRYLNYDLNMFKVK